MTPLFRQSIRQLTQRRQISIVARLRSAARTFEPHPFERMPTSQQAAKADWGRQFRRVGDAGMLYVFLPLLMFPFIDVFVLSLPAPSRA
jgi:hypothetical protein